MALKLTKEKRVRGASGLTPGPLAGPASRPLREVVPQRIILWSQASLASTRAIAGPCIRLDLDLVLFLRYQGIRSHMIPGVDLHIPATTGQIKVVGMGPPQTLSCVPFPLVYLGAVAVGPLLAPAIMGSGALCSARQLPLED